MASTNNISVTSCAGHVKLVLLVFLDVFHPGTPGQSRRGVDEAIEKFVVLLLDKFVLIKPVDTGDCPEILCDLGELFLFRGYYP